MDIKNKKLVVSDEKIGKWNKFVFTDGTKLGNVLNFLPHGIINKNVTGIGATHLEIVSLRNSIIVVPLRSIAISKVQKHPNCLYVGGNKEKKGASPSEIKNYLKSSNDYKKFIVVADSLPKLLDILGESEYLKFFIMIDEIDSFQLDSSFRESLEYCLDYYKLFPESQRALVSSTMMEFSDPELANENCHEFDYQNKPVRIIELNRTENVKGVSIDLIAEMYDSKSDDKVLIAYNTVVGCKAMALHLIKDFDIPKEEIKIYCSPKRRDDVGEFFAELDGGKLGGRINFITSAYFVGVDIEDKYHLIAICNKELRQTLLSLNRLKQIAGRARNGLLSEVVVYNLTHLSTDDQIPLIRLLESAQTKIKALECIAKNYKSDPLLKERVLDVRNAIIGREDVFGYNLVRTNINDEIVVSYFNIDSCIDTMNTAKFLYSDSHTMENELKIEGHIIDANIKESTTSVATFVEDESKADLIFVAINRLRELAKPQDVLNLILESKSKVQTTFYERYMQLFIYYADKELLFEKLIELSKKNETAYNNHKLQLKFTKDETPLRKIADEIFLVGSEFTSTEILHLLNKAYALSNFNYVIESPVSAIKVINQLYKVQKLRRKERDGQPLHKIKGLHKLPSDMDQ